MRKKFWRLPEQSYLQSVLPPITARFAVFVKFHQSEAQSFPISTVCPITLGALTEYKGTVAASGQNIWSSLFSILNNILIRRQQSST